MAMSNIQTTDSVALRYLITETLFGMDEDAPVTAELSAVATAPAAAPQFPFYGKNVRNYLFLASDPQHEWLSVSALEALTKTLTALKLTADDIALLNLGTLSAMPQQGDIFAFFNPKIVVSLGVSLPWEGFANPEPNTVLAHQGITVFHTFTFDEMLADAEKKRLFWGTVKTLLI
ncbi:hypothetical protein SAMN05660226_02168 [Parapedobacter luteus]|uniref:Uracil DNA glycosylase superfamily protein n=1 Tax=Parapedobacter luteus TaxID=623280 RepID=A0A1T5CFC5_9SPHI|nr:hypothetical protein [Parapedobacter luteus]SKB58043.1 hypothetical protein SAMN05660226_02168 [Parapedobacter luteus]